jgi:hypothetical protein
MEDACGYILANLERSRVSRFGRCRRKSAASDRRPRSVMKLLINECELDRSGGGQRGYPRKSTPSPATSGQQHAGSGGSPSQVVEATTPSSPIMPRSTGSISRAGRIRRLPHSTRAPHRLHARLSVLGQGPVVGILSEKRNIYSHWSWFWRKNAAPPVPSGPSTRRQRQQPSCCQAIAAAGL